MSIVALAPGWLHSQPLSALPPAVCDYLHGEDRMRQMERAGS